MSSEGIDAAERIAKAIRDATPEERQRLLGKTELLAERDAWKRAASKVPYLQAKLSRLAALTPEEMTGLVEASLRSSPDQKVEEAIVGVISDLIADDAPDPEVARCESFDPWGGGLQCSRKAHDDDQCQFEGIAWRKTLPDDEGCGCTELCSMGPTCPGGSLAGLTGSGCWRTKPEETGVIRDLIERSSLGTPEAKALRDSVSDEDAAKIVARAREMEADQ